MVDGLLVHPWRVVRPRACRPADRLHRPLHFHILAKRLLQVEHAIDNRETLPALRDLHTLLTQRVVFRPELLGELNRQRLLKMGCQAIEKTLISLKQLPGKLELYFFFYSLRALLIET